MDWKKVLLKLTAVILTTGYLLIINSTSLAFALDENETVISLDVMDNGQERITTRDIKGA